MKFLVFPIFFLFTSAFSYDLMKDEEWFSNYFNQLKNTYDKRVAPIGTDGPGSTIKVNSTMYILDISKVDDSSMDYTAQFYFRQEWYDDRLRYTDRTEVIVLRNADDIWTPDLFFTGAREGKQHMLMHPNAMIRIQPSGHVFWSVRVTVRIPCLMDLSSFPHDIQKCKMRMESYAHTKKDIDVSWTLKEKSIGYHKELALLDFDLIACNGSEEVEYLTSGNYKVLHVDLTFQRKFGFFAIKLYIPFIILVIVSMLSLWIKAEERGIRLSLLITILYFMINISSEIQDNIPDAPYTKGTDVWIGFCESLVFSVFLEFIVVALISCRPENDASDRKGDILLNMESDSKEESLKSETLKSHLSKLVSMFDARNGGKGKRDGSTHRIDRIFRIIFPVIFALFNIIYWGAYCCKSVE